MREGLYCRELCCEKGGEVAMLAKEKQDAKRPRNGADDDGE